MTVADFGRYEMRRIADLSGLCQLLHEHKDAASDVVMLAGGTDFLVQVSQGPTASDPLPLVVDISRLDELRFIELSGDTLRVGAATSYLELQRHPAVQQRAPLIERMTHDIGGPTIQARGTLGGNLATASPAADGVAAIAAYDPIIEVRSVRGSRRIPFAELQTGYKQSTRSSDEVIVAIELELPPEGTAWCWRKVGTRMAQAISKVALAAIAVVEDGRATRFGAAMASVAPITTTLPALRELVTSRPLAEVTGADVDAAIATDICPIDDVRSTAVYRQHTAKAITRAFLRDLGAAS